MFVLDFEAAVSEKYLLFVILYLKNLSKTFLMRSVVIIPYCDVITTCNIFIL